MKTKHAINQEIEKLSLEIAALEAERDSALLTKDWSELAEVNSLINIRFGTRMGLQQALFYINFHNEIA